jgi:hypothetical protein
VVVYYKGVRVRASMQHAHISTQQWLWSMCAAGGPRARRAESSPKTEDALCLHFGLAHKQTSKKAKSSTACSIHTHFTLTATTLTHGSSTPHQNFAPTPSQPQHVRVPPAQVPVMRRVVRRRVVAPAQDEQTQSRRCPRLAPAQVGGVAGPLLEVLGAVRQQRPPLRPAGVEDVEGGEVLLSTCTLGGGGRVSTPAREVEVGGSWGEARGQEGEASGVGGRGSRKGGRVLCPAKFVSLTGVGFSRMHASLKLETDRPSAARNSLSLF